MEKRRSWSFSPPLIIYASRKLRSVSISSGNEGNLDEYFHRLIQTIFKEICAAESSSSHENWLWKLMLENFRSVNAMIFLSFPREALSPVGSEFSLISREEYKHLKLLSLYHLGPSDGSILFMFFVNCGGFCRGSPRLKKKLWQNDDKVPLNCGEGVFRCDWLSGFTFWSTALEDELAARR